MSRSPLTSCTVGSYKCACFTYLNEEEQELVDANSVEIIFDKGENIFKKGTHANHVMYLQEGLVKVYIEDRLGPLILKVIPPCNILGLVNINAENSTYPYSAMAYVESKVTLIDINVFRQLIATNAKFAAEVIKILGENSLQIYGRFYCLTYKQSYGRLADIILCLTDRIYKSRSFELLMSRKELAELSGIATENLSRILKKFKDEGLIDFEGKMFSIMNYDRLKQISENG